MMNMIESLRALYFFCIRTGLKATMFYPMNDI